MNSRKIKTLCCTIAAITLTACGNTAGESSSSATAPAETSAPEAVEAVTPETSETASAADTSDISPEPAVTPSDASSAADSSKSDADKKSERKKLAKEITLEYPDSAEVFSSIKMSEFLRTNAEIKNPDEAVATSIVGNVEHTIKLLYKGEEFEVKLNYAVRDTTAPVCLNPGDGYTVAAGTQFDLDDVIGYGDNYDKHPTATYTGTVDTSTEGIYPITVTVSDSSGNTTSWDVDIGVGYSASSPTFDDPGASLPFSDFAALYGGSGRHLGIDVSTWQGDIDFNAVKNAGCEFVIMRMGYSADGMIHPDDWYDENMRKARSAGLKVGVYFYSRDNDEETVRGIARWINNSLGGAKLDFPVAFDWEDFYHFQTYGMSIHDLNELFETFSDELSGMGYDTMLYSSRNFLENFWENRRGHKVWIANYAETNSYEGSYMMWQRCGYGTIDGISGNVDLNVLYD